MIGNRIKFSLSVIILVFFVCVSPGISQAGAYMFIDSTGVINYVKMAPLRSKVPQAPALSESFDIIIKNAQKKHGIDSNLIKAVIRVESAFNAKAISKKGAKGLMQIMPGNYKALAVKDPFSPVQNIMGGTLYLKKLIKRYDYKVSLALAAYNAGPSAVDKYGTIPPYKETQSYVKKVMRLYRQYKEKDPPIS
jgi:soluble lytic murein transglycosylase-like protein